MNPAVLGVAGVVGLLALMSGRKNDAAEAETEPEDVKSEVKRIVQESKEIVQGKRDSYSDNPAKKVTAREAAERTGKVIAKVKEAGKVTDGAEDALAIEAARMAAQQDASREVKKAPPPIIKPIGKNTGTPDWATKKAAIDKRPPPIFVSQPVVNRQPPPPAPVTPSRPAGYDETKARNAAVGLARHIKKANYNYERKALEAWQRTAGIAPDGVYGPAAANALRYYTAEAPKKLFAKSRDGTPYPNTPYPPPEWS